MRRGSSWIVFWGTLLVSAAFCVAVATAGDSAIPEGDAKVTSIQNSYGKILAVDMECNLTRLEVDSGRITLSASAKVKGKALGMTIQFPVEPSSILEDFAYNRSWSRRTPGKVNYYRFTAYLLDQGDETAELNRFLAQYFSVGPDGGVIKSRGYGCTSIVEPVQIVERGGVLSLWDLGVQGTFQWNIRVLVSLETKTVQLRFREL